MQCTAITGKGTQCTRPALPGHEVCKIHLAIESNPLVDEEERSFFDGYSQHEVVTYVANMTGGRVRLDERMPIEALIDRAEEYM